MKHISAALLLALAKKEITEANITAILSSVGVTPNLESVKIVVKACEGKSCDQLVQEGLSKMTSAVAVATVAVASNATAKKEEKKPEPEEESEEVAADLDDLF